MIKVKGAGDIQTSCGRGAHGGTARTRAQVVAELAYLEHEKDRLERELGVWTGNQKRAENRLQSAHQRIALLQGILEVEQPSAKRRPPSTKEEAPDSSQEAETSWREIPLEY
jgi:hypothetical protein